MCGLQHIVLKEKIKMIKFLKIIDKIKRVDCHDQTFEIA